MFNILIWSYLLTFVWASIDHCVLILSWVKISRESFEVSICDIYKLFSNTLYSKNRVTMSRWHYDFRSNSDNKFKVVNNELKNLRRDSRLQLCNREIMFNLCRCLSKQHSRLMWNQQAIHSINTSHNILITLIAFY